MSEIISPAHMLSHVGFFVLCGHFMKSPVNSLFQSRKFWLMILDLVVSLIMFFGAKYLAASAFDDIKFLVAAIQPVFITIIAAIAVEDSAATKAGVVYIDGQPYKLKTISEGE